jgi:hypothetical protein
MGVARSAVAGAGSEAPRRAEMREPKCALNLPIVIGQTPPPNRGDRTVASPSLWQEAGYRCFHWATHIQPLFSQ